MITSGSTTGHALWFRAMPAPSVLEFDKAGNLLQAWGGGPADPGFLDKKCRQQDGCYWPSREHGIYVDHNDFVYIGGNGQAQNFHGQYPWAPNFGNDSQVLKFKMDGTFVYQIGKAGAKGPNSNDTNGGINGTPEPFLPADMTVDPRSTAQTFTKWIASAPVVGKSDSFIGHTLLASTPKAICTPEKLTVPAGYRSSFATERADAAERATPRLEDIRHRTNVKVRAARAVF